jgi:uncharacterized membrane protein YhaH (DUF805 family)
MATWSVKINGKVVQIVSTTVIGRTAGDILISHDSISKKHCQLTPNKNGLSVRDLGSTNGTSINGTELPKDAEKLMSKDFELKLGDQIFNVQAPRSKPASSGEKKRPSSPPPAQWEKYFSFKSRLSRLEFFIGWSTAIGVLAVLQILGGWVLSGQIGGLVSLLAIFGALAFFSTLFPMWIAARLRDIGQSGKWALLCYLFFPVPFLYFGSLVIPTKSRSKK